MSTAADHFASFVAVLADALDDHDATGEDWPRRLHLSRFHFDRIVASVGRRAAAAGSAAGSCSSARRTGWSPPDRADPRHRGRGRLRLARGVHPRVHQGVRRRARASGARSPTRIRIERAQRRALPPTRAASGCPRETKVTPMDLLTKMVEHHVWLTGEMVELRRRGSPTTQLDEPIELDVDDDRADASASLLSRLVGQMGMWNAAMANRDYDWSVEEHESRRLDAARGSPIEGPRYLAHVREVADAGPPRRHLRRRAVRAGRGVHLRRDDRPRADLRGAPPHASWCWPSTSTASTSSAGATRCAGSPSRRPERAAAAPRHG